MSTIAQSESPTVNTDYKGADDKLDDFWCRISAKGSVSEEDVTWLNNFAKEERFSEDVSSAAGSVSSQGETCQGDEDASPGPGSGSVASSATETDPIPEQQGGKARTPPDHTENSEEYQRKLIVRALAELRQGWIVGDSLLDSGLMASHDDIVTENDISRDDLT